MGSNVIVSIHLEYIYLAAILRLLTIYPIMYTIDDVDEILSL